MNVVDVVLVAAACSGLLLSIGVLAYSFAEVRRVRSIADFENEHEYHLNLLRAEVRRRLKFLQKERLSRGQKGFVMALAELTDSKIIEEGEMKVVDGVLDE